MYALSSLLLAPGVSRTVLRVAQGEDPSLGDAFLLAAGYSASLSLVLPQIVAVKEQIVLSEAVTGDPVLFKAYEQLTPPLAEQMANGDDMVILNTTVTDVQQHTVDGKTVTTLLATQQVADASEFRFEHLMDLTSRTSRGEMIPVSDIFLTVIAELSANSGTLFNLLSNPIRVYESMRGTREVSVTITAQSASHEETNSLGDMTQIKDLHHQNPNGEVKGSLQRKCALDEKTHSELSGYHVQTTRGEVTFENHTSTAAPEASLAAGSTSITAIEETRTSTVTQSEQAWGKLDVTAGSSFEATTNNSETSQTRVVRNIHVMEGNALSTLEDGQLTEAELMNTQAELYSTQLLQNTTAEREIDVPTPQALTQSDTTVSSTEARAHLTTLMQQMKRGEPLDKEAICPVTSKILAAQPASADYGAHYNSRMATSFQEQGVEQVSEKSHEKIEKEGIFLDDIKKTKTTTVDQETFTSKIEADHFSMTTRYQTDGLYSQATPVPEDKTESLSKISVQETRLARQRCVEESQTSIEYTGWFLGKDTEVSNTTFTERIDRSGSVYHVENRDIFSTIEDGRLTESELNALNATVLQTQTAPTELHSFIDTSTASKQFKEGFVEWIPFGTLVSTGMKSSFGYELAASDYFWSVADGALSLAMLGTGTALKTSVKGVGTAIAKNEVQKAGKLLARQGGEALTSMGKNFVADIASPAATVSQTASYTLKHGVKEALKEGGQQVVGHAQQLWNGIAGVNTKDLSSIHGLSQRKTINARHAGQTISPADLKNSALKERYPDGIRFGKDGYPDFSPHAKASVEVKMTGINAHDFKSANTAAGFSETPAGYTWHHHQNGRSMELIPTDLHQEIRHTGGASLARAQTANLEKSTRLYSAGLNIAIKALNVETRE